MLGRVGVFVLVCCYEQFVFEIQIASNLKLFRKEMKIQIFDARKLLQICAVQSNYVGKCEGPVAKHNSLDAIPKSIRSY